jgi:hypothetical protein
MKMNGRVNAKLDMNMNMNTNVQKGWENRVRSRTIKEY